MNYLFYQTSATNTCCQGMTFYDVFPEVRKNKQWMAGIDRMGSFFYYTKLSGDLGDFDENGEPTEPVDFGYFSGGLSDTQTGIYQGFWYTEIERANVRCQSIMTSNPNFASHYNWVNSGNTKLVYVKAEDNGTGADRIKRTWCCANLPNLKKADLYDAYGEGNWFYNCPKLEEATLKNRFNGIVFGTNSGKLYNCSSLKRLIIDPTSTTPQRVWFDNTSMPTVNSWGNGVTHLDCESIVSWANYFGRGGAITSIADPVKVQMGKPAKYTHTMGKLGLDINMVDSNGIKCIIPKEEADANGIAYEWLDGAGDETSTLCVRADSELHTALNTLFSKGLVWTLVFH